MTMMLRSFNEEGMDCFRTELQAVRDGGGIEGIRALVTGDRFSSPVSPEIDIDNRSFETAAEAAEYLGRKLKPLPYGTIFGDSGLWSWLAAYYFDSLCAIKNRKQVPLADDHYIPAQHAWRYYRHLLLGPVSRYLMHGEKARLFQEKPAHVHGDLTEAFFGRQEFAQNRGLVSALDMLYWDAEKGGPKKGSRPSKHKPGTLRRFITVTQQLDLTYDLQSMTGEQILELLPDEFDRFRPASQIGSSGLSGEETGEAVALAVAPAMPDGAKFD